MIRDSLPEKFRFYHLGDVKRVDSPSPSRTSLESLPEDSELQGLRAVAFNLKGDVQGTLMILFNQKLDVSTYTELGNVLASKLATRLSEVRGADVLITPPRNLSPLQLEAFLIKIRKTLSSQLIAEKRKPQVVRSRYIHSSVQSSGEKNISKEIPVDALFVTAPSEGAAYDQRTHFFS